MRDIRSRIAQRQGVDLSTQQIQDLAARRLESILDPRAVKPSLLDALRRTAREPSPPQAFATPDELVFTFEDSTIYDSHRGALRFMRRLLNPLLKLLFNPNPVVGALHRQARLNALRAERDADREREQTEWNALHYEIVQRLVTEVSRVSLELQSITTRIESLDAKLDFNEKRVRSIEGATHRTRPQVRSAAPAPVGATPARETPPIEAPTKDAAGEVDVQATEPAKRRRRRRRGRRPDSPQTDAARVGEAAQSGTPETEGRTAATPQETSDTPPTPPIAVELPASADVTSEPAPPPPATQQLPVETPPGEPATADVPSTGGVELHPGAETAAQHRDTTPASLDDESDDGRGER